MAKVIKDNAGQTQSEAGTLAKYFRQPDEKLQDFMAGMKALTPEGKTELAHGAAKNLGWTVIDEA